MIDPRHTSLAALVSLALLVVVPSEMSRSDAAVPRSDRVEVPVADSQDETRLDFSSPADADLFRTSGQGSWKVRKGALRLRSNPTRRQRYPLSVLRAPIDSAVWTLEVTARTTVAREAGFSVVFSFRDRRNYAYVHIDARPSLSGLYVVRGGKQRRVAGIAARARPGSRQIVQVRRTEGKIKVFLEAKGRTTFVGGAAFVRSRGLARVVGSEPLTAGIGSWGSDVDVDRLRITRPADSSSSGPAGLVDDPTSLLVAPSGGRSVAVSSSASLVAALAAARPGDVITMADGTYTTNGVQAAMAVGQKRYVGTFVGERSGTAQLPIVLQGSRAAVIDGAPGKDGAGTQYGVYLAGASFWRLRGFTVQNVAKGIVLDHTQHSVVEFTDVHAIGQEAIHLRAFSSDNVVRGNVIRDTGRTNATFGEGVYVGSATSNWSTYSDGAPDASDRNQVLGNDIAGTSAENIDIKEGTTGGVISGNRLDGAAMTGSYADSWIDVKGNDWVVESNTGTHALSDGFQVHVAVSGWGQGNSFRSNSATVNGPGFGFWVQQGAVANVVSCSNVVAGAARGFSNTPCS